ncbi:hypothetical protein [Actinoplanes subtropicus]|uniref:hypothetical protein n=1 Tax=Actinoplanes subtropicus TaxID=543632 RepID=UPI000AEA1AAD|nr:hypothetical protein [Actinoplanes subtropicus]
MDQREWDYGARMPRDRRAAQPWPSPSPERADFAEPEPKWQSLTDTGSMEPSPEALAWQRRADAWAQQSEPGEQAVEPANRWSEVASTGRTTFPADGMGWRTETAEWRATGARWRQTTEWRSTTGSHGWRSTTEAWQSGGANQYNEPAETPSSQPAISSTAWSADPPAEEARPAWQQFTSQARPWEQPQQQSTPSWQQPSPRTPAESPSSWQQLVGDTPAERPSWQRDAIDGTATWNDSGSSGATKDPSSMSSWLRMEDPAETPSWQTPRDDGRHLVREDDRAAWRRDAELGAGSPPVGRRRAPEGGSSKPSGGTGWATRSDSDNWAGHTDTGNIPLYPDPATPSTPTWAGADPASRPDASTGRRVLPTSSFEGAGTAYDDPTRGRGYDPTRSAGYDAPASGAGYEPSRGAGYDPGRGAGYDPGRGAGYDDPGRRSTYGEPTRRSRHADSDADQPGRPVGGAASAPMPLSYDTRPGGSQDTRLGGGYDARPGGSHAAESAPGPRRGRYADEAPPVEVPRGYPGDTPPGSGFGRGASPGYGTEPPPAAPTSSYGRGAGLAEPPPAAPTSSYGRGAGLAEPPPAAPTTGFGRGAAAYPVDPQPSGGFGRGSGVAEPPPAAPTSSFGRGAAPAYGTEPPPAAPTSSYGRGAGLAEPPPGSFGRGAGTAEPPSDNYGPGPAEPPSGSYGRGAGLAEPPSAAPTTGYGRGAGPDYPADQRPAGGGRRRGAADAEGGARSAPGGRRSRAEQPPAPPARGGKARYNETHSDDWREQTGSWVAEPDTSSWVRDPDTGQWSRSEDDPRVLAWREEAARRESMSDGKPPQRRELPAGPARPEPPVDDWRSPRDDAGPASSPRSAMPAAPRSSMPSSAPRSATPYGNPPDDEPTYPNGVRGGGSYGSPRRELPSGRRPDDAGYGAAPAGGPSYGGGPANGGGTYGSPRRELQGGRRPDDTGYGAAPVSGPSYGSRRVSGSAPTSSPTYGSAPTSGPSYGGGTYGSAPRSGPAYGSAAGGGPAYGSGSASAPTSGPVYGSARRELPSGRDYDGPGNAPRSGLPYADSPAGGTTYGGSADYRSGGRRRDDDDAPPPGGGRRSAGYDEAPSQETWRRTPETGPSWQSRALGAAPEAPSWSRGGDPAQRPPADDWRRELAEPGQRPAPADWRSDLAEPAQRPANDWRSEFSEPAENGRGSASYREGGGDDWRRDLSPGGGSLAEGESRRFGTSDYVPFRSGGAAAVPRSSNLSMTSTSLISPVPREQRDLRDPMVRPQRSGNGFQQGQTGSYERRPVTGAFPTSRRSDLLDPDDEEGDQDSGGPLAAIGYTVIWYGVPLVLFVVYMLVVNTGSQSHALGTLAKAAPQFLISLVLSVGVAVGLRKFSSSWKAISVGLAAAVVGGGLATVLSSAITGNSLS